MRVVISLTGLDLNKQVNVLFVICTEITESKPVKLDTSCTEILTPTV